MSLVRHISQLCFSRNYGKSFAPPSAQTYSRSRTLCFTPCLQGMSALTWLLGSKGKRKRNEKFALRQKAQQNNPLLNFIFGRGIEKIVRTFLGNRFPNAYASVLGKRVYKTLKFRVYILYGCPLNNISK